MSNLRDGQSDIRDINFILMKHLDERISGNIVINDSKADIPVISDGNCSKAFGADTVKEDLDMLKEQMKKLADVCKTESDVEIYKEPCTNATLSISEDCVGGPDGVNIILTKRGKQILARCEAGWLIIAHRYDGSVDFNLDWDNYQHGFGNIRKEHFIGFENILPVLLQKRYKARFDLTTWESETGYAEYQTFDINDKNDKYRISIDDYSGTAGDSMQWSNHMRFTTKDNDNDRRTGNCAEGHEGPFWYDSCNWGNKGSIFGRYAKNPKCSNAWNCLTWYDWPKKLPGVDNNSLYSFKEVKIKIRPIY
ncbi:unnamed protein product [Owenia fusiformis]|uniref:Fibrinogen C-terminal domain-containing protein n=1 Tax=Owenia fusiformis TaxID=6347 RepID=A0A8S4NHI4_OWEFU|nr:unnamed protein product [Owenia fusiformis]